ncbi:twin-arginine translocation signal domain-containing protein [Methylophaga sp.]|uniref:twin-arginine translocation signal domain-containing protein n=1 Tax=Methylophaga sp. TaxID=2024840 RepID=UPI003F69DEEC
MSTQSSRSRRDFLQKITSVVGGGAAIAATSGLVQASPIEKPVKREEKPVSKGYQRTEHVDTYYHLADF